MGERIAIVTPWYPTASRPFHGSFVQGFAETVARHVPADVDVLHLEAWGLPAGIRAQRRAWHDLVQLTRDPTRFPDSTIAVRHLPAPVHAGDEFGPIAAGHRRFLSEVAGGRRLPHPVVHAHVGLGGGYPALELLEGGTRFFVTEHATFLERLFADVSARRHYDEVIARSDAFLCVSDLLREQLLARFPHHEDRLRVVPNPIDFDAIPMVPDRAEIPRRWMYAGSLTERKGVRLLLEAFAIAQEDHGDLTLTFYGDGPERAVLEARIDELGLDGQVRLPGSIPPERMVSAYAANDLLVHLSAYETFGMTLVEAVAVGIPVIATTCGGPEETLGPIESAVGRLLPVDSTPEMVASAYAHLRSCASELDLESGRADLRSRYGRAAVGARLRELYQMTEGSA